MKTIGLLHVSSWLKYLKNIVKNNNKKILWELFLNSQNLVSYKSFDLCDVLFQNDINDLHGTTLNFIRSSAYF